MEKMYPSKKKTKSKNKRVDFPFHTTSAPRDHYLIGEGKHALEGLRPFTWRIYSVQVLKLGPHNSETQV